MVSNQGLIRKFSKKGLDDENIYSGFVLIRFHKAAR